MLVGATFICLCLMMMALATDYNPDASDALGEAMAYHSHFVHHSPSSDLGKLRLPGTNLTFPWAKRLPQATVFSSSDFVLRSPPTKEEIILTGSHPSRQVDDFTAMNSNIEGIVDAKLKSCLSDDRRGSSDSRTSTQRQGNNMNIDVSGISVRAINTVPGGKAMATSNIVIKPVQILVCPSEVEEKLK
jgi:hypothetical protein